MWLISTRAWNATDSQPLDIPRYNSCTPIKSKCLSITREMFLLHYAQLCAQLLWITLKLLLQDYFNHMCHLLSHFLLSSQRGKSRRDSFTLKKTFFKSGTARRMIWALYKCKIQTIKSTQVSNWIQVRIIQTQQVPPFKIHLEIYRTQVMSSSQSCLRKISPFLTQNSLPQVPVQLTVPGMPCCDTHNQPSQQEWEQVMQGKKNRLFPLFICVDEELVQLAL